jgi:SNF2 family DNA or RNA helicase
VAGRTKTHGELRHVRRHVYDELRQVWVAGWVLEARADVITKVKRLFPKAQANRRGFVTLTDTPELARDLEWILQRWPLDLKPADRKHLKARADQHREREQLVHDILTGAQPHVGLAGWQDPIRTPREYQLTAADLALATGQLLIADDLGLGKTMTGLLVLRNPDALPALVVCPTHLPRQWEQEIAKTLPMLRTHVVRSLSPYDPAKRREMRGHDPDVLIMGYAKLRGWGNHLAGRIRTVIFDEAQELRRTDSDKYLAAAQIADGAGYRVGLTATPVYNYGGEIHNVMSVLCPDALGSREEFAREWCNGLWSDKVAVDDPAGLSVYLRDQGLMIRRTVKDVGRELPHGEAVKIPHSIESDGDVFERLAADAIDLAQMIVARSATKQELWQARGEFDWKLRQATGIAKAPYVAEFVKLLLDSEQKVILFGWHRAVYDIWADRLQEHDPVFYTGEESPAQKQRAKERFLTDDDCRIFVMSLRSGAGLDGLQHNCRVGVFGELDWSPAMHDQCIGRYARDGQLEEALAYFLVSDHGADPAMAEVLEAKRQQQDPLLDPDAPLFQQAPDVGDRVALLAEQILAKRGRRAA